MKDFQVPTEEHRILELGGIFFFIGKEMRSRKSVPPTTLVICQVRSSSTSTFPAKSDLI